MWGALFTVDPNAKEKALDPKFSGTYFAVSDAGVQKFEKTDNTTITKAFGGKGQVELLLYYHASPSPYGYEQLRALPQGTSIPSALSVGSVAEPIFHKNTNNSVMLWGQLNLKDKATVRGPAGRFWVRLGLTGVCWGGRPVDCFFRMSAIWRCSWDGCTLRARQR